MISSTTPSPKARILIVATTLVQAALIYLPQLSYDHKWHWFSDLALVFWYALVLTVPVMMLVTMC